MRRLKLLVLVLLLGSALTATYSCRIRETIAKGKKVLDAAAPVVMEWVEAYKDLKAEFDLYRAGAEAKFNEYEAELQRLGAPTGSYDELLAWVKNNPLTAGGSPVAVGAVLLRLWWARRREKKSLATLVASVDDVKVRSPEIGEAMMEAIRVRAARDPGFEATIKAAKKANAIAST